MISYAIGAVTRVSVIRALIEIHGKAFRKIKASNSLEKPKQKQRSRDMLSHEKSTLIRTYYQSFVSNNQTSKIKYRVTHHKQVNISLPIMLYLHVKNHYGTGSERKRMNREEDPHLPRSY